MSKRKQQNLEIEQKLQKQKKIYQLVALAVAALIVVVICFNIWAARDRRWVLYYDGGRVATSDFRAIFDLEMEGNPAAREAALGSLQQIIVVLNQAEYHGVTMSQEDFDEAVEGMEDLRQWRRSMTNNVDTIRYITNERLAMLFNAPLLAEQLMDIYVPAEEIDVDEEEFAENMEEYFETNIYNYMEMEVYFLFNESREAVDEAYELIGTTDFAELVERFGDDHDPETGVVPVPLPQPLAVFTNLGLSDEDREHLLNLEVGEVSHIVEVPGGDEFPNAYMLVKMVNRVDPDRDEITANMRAGYIDTRRNEAFFELVEQWVIDANFTVNQRGYNSV